MTVEAPDFKKWIGLRIEERAVELSQQWLEAIAPKRKEAPQRIFPTGSLLDHIPQFLCRLARSLGTGDDPEADAHVRHEIHRLALLRRMQGYAAAEVLEEYHLLQQIVLDVVDEEVERYPGRLAPRDVLAVARLIGKAHGVLSDLTTQAYHEDEVGDQMDRAQMLAGFGRIVSDRLRHDVEEARRLLEALEADGASAEVMEDIDAAVKRIGRVADEVFAIAVAEGGADELAAVHAQLDEVVSRLVAELMPMAARQGVEIVLDEPLPPIVVDVPRLQVVLVNLLSNAVQYVDPDKDEHRVQVCSRMLPDQLLLEVRDNGIGMTDEALDRVLTRELDEDGRGLGLPIARQAAREMGGDLEIASEVGVGTTVTVHLPPPAERSEDIR